MFVYVCDSYPATLWTSVSVSSSRKSSTSFTSSLSCSSSSSSRINVLSSSRCAWRQTKMKSETLYYNYILESLLHNFDSATCIFYTVMPSLDFRARSMTVVMAVRWGVRQSGLTVDTAEYRLYLTEGKTEVKEKLQKKKVIWSGIWLFYTINSENPNKAERQLWRGYI